MTFLNLPLLIAMAAAGVPLLLHLLSKRPPRRVVFPPVRFLQGRIQTVRTRMRVQRWLLLALRMIVLGLLGFVMAQPQVHAMFSSQWFVVGIVAFFGLGLLAMAVVAIVGRFNQSRWQQLFGRGKPRDGRNTVGRPSGENATSAETSQSPRLLIGLLIGAIAMLGAALIGGGMLITQSPSVTVDQRTPVA
ncbi:MAG: BatA domain-containing protein, partial [Planctomycetota bacterium]